MKTALANGVRKFRHLYRGRKEKSPERKARRFAEPVFCRPGLERLEDRLAPSVGTDVKTYIQDLLATETASFTQTETINNASIGDFLQIGTLSLTENATLSAGGDWSGTVTLSASDATLFPGNSFGAAINNSNPGQAGLTGTFTIGAASGSNDFSLTAADLVVNVGEALTLTATGVTLNYDSGTTGSQTLISGKSASVTSPQF